MRLFIAAIPYGVGRACKRVFTRSSFPSHQATKPLENHLEGGSSFEGCR
jgi:hypothetical protein